MIELDRFEIQEKVGEGAMGEVYKARQISMDRIVAIKVLFPELAEDLKFAHRFMHEARAIGKLNHPNVVQGIDFGRSDKHLYFVMEYVNGPSLYEILKQGPLEEDEALEIGLQVAQAIEHGHGQGIVHRDIKPGNIMISTEGTAKVTDYGLAKRSEGDSGKSTGAGKVLGTPYYISPEQARGDEDIDIRSDIYSLGATLYHIATGKPPFPGKNAPEIMSRALNERVPDPRKEKPELTSAFSKLVLKMTQKDRNKRPLSPAELVSEIRRTMRSSAGERQRQSIGANLKRTLGRVVARTPEGESALSSRTKTAVAGILAAVGVVIILVFLLPGAGNKKDNEISKKPVQNNNESRHVRRSPVGQPTQTKESYAKEQMKKAEAELAEKARAAYLEVEAFAKGASDVEAAVVRLHEMAASYSGPYAEKAKKLASELKQKWEIEGVNELNGRKQQAMQAIEELDYGKAVTIYHEFPVGLRKTAAGEEAYRLGKMVLEQAMDKFKGIRDEAERLIAQGNYDLATEKYNEALKFGIKEIVSQAKARIERIKNDAEKARLAKIEEDRKHAEYLYAGFFPQFSGFMEKGDFKEALEFCKRLLADESKSAVHRMVRQHMNDAEMVVRVQDAGAEAIKGLKLQEFSFELDGGRSVKGIVREIKEDIIDIEVSNMKGAIIGIEIARISGRTYIELALRVLGNTPESHFACGVYLLLCKKDGSAAQKEFELAEKGGLDVSKYKPMVEAMRKGELDTEAVELLAEFRKLIKRKKWKEVAEAADKLTGKYGKTKAVETSRAEIDKANTEAMFKLAAEENAKTSKKMKLAPGLIGSYYNGRNFDDFKHRRIDAVVDFDWGNRPPHRDVRANNFSVRWEGFVVIPKSGRYTFIVNSDDGCRMWLNGQELFNDWVGRGAQDSSKQLTLKKGMYPIKIEYFEAGGAASAKLIWNVDGNRQVIPADYLCHSAD